MNEQGHIVTPQPPQQPLTARNLEDFALCPQKYLLSFFTTPAESRRFIGGPAALHRALRSALVQAYQMGGPGQVSAASLLRLFEQNWEGELCADSLEEEQLHSEGVQILEAYHQTHKNQPNEAIASDMRFEDEIAGHRFVAVADRVDQAEDGTITLLRYKSSHRPPSPAELAKDISAGLLLLLGQAHFADQDLSAEAALAAKTDCQVAVYALRPGRLVVAPIDQAQRNSLQERIINLAHSIRQAQQFPTNKGRHCRWCRSQARCPAWRDAHYQPEEGQ